MDFEPSIDLVQNANSEIEAEVNDAETSSNSVIEVHSASPSTDKAYIDVEASTAKAPDLCCQHLSLHDEIHQIRKELNDLKELLKTPAPIHPTGSMDTFSKQLEIDRLRSENKSLMTTVQVLSGLVSKNDISTIPNDPQPANNDNSTTQNPILPPEATDSTESKKARKKRKKAERKQQEPSPATGNPGRPAQPRPVISSSSPDSNRSPKIVIAGDSIVQHVPGWELSSANRRVSVKAFSGASIEDMEDYLKPISRKEPDRLILHIGTNDVPNTQDSRAIAEGIINLGHQFQQDSPHTEIAISSLLPRVDRNDHNDDQNC